VIENTPFTPEEQQEIARRLDKLATDVSHALSLSGAQTNALEGKIDYLIEASTRLGRKDWLNNFIGVTLPFVLAAALAPEAARALFLTFLRSIGILYPEGKRAISASILLGHTHWDHIQGFPFFSPAFVK
jgi:hypothetical protein